MTRVMRFVAAGKADKPYSGQPAGVVAIWNAGADGSDNAPFLDPRNNLSKLWLHSDLDYLRIAKVVKSTDPGMAPINVDTWPNNQALRAQQPLFAHGLGYSPLISGDLITGGYRQPVAGTPIPIPGGDPSTAGFRWAGLTADGYYVYMHLLGFACPAQTLHWEVRLYDETFQTLSGPANVFYAAPREARFAALGKVSADRRFVRKVISGAGQFRALGCQTLRLVPNQYGPQTHFSDGQLDLIQYAQSNGALSTGGSLHAAGTECEIVGGTPRGNGFTYDALGIELADGADVVFTTAQAMEVSLGQVKGSLALPAVIGADNVGDGHTVDYDIAPAPAGAAALRGFGKFSDPTGFLPPSLNFDFSGSILLGAAALPRSGGGNTILGLRHVSPVIEAGRFKIRDQYFASRASPDNARVDWPAVTLNYDMRMAAFVGGI